MQDCAGVKPVRVAVPRAGPEHSSSAFPRLVVPSGGRNKPPRAGVALAALLVTLLAGTLTAVKAVEPKELPFRYVGGTENLDLECRGKLEVTSSALIFTCPSQPLEVPFGSIVLMEFRPDLSRRVRHMKLQWKWKLYPSVGSRNKNRYFTIVYREEGALHGVVLQVDPLMMRPYLAEIELKTGKRVQVKGYEDYQ